MNDIKQFKSILKQGISRNTDVLLGCEFLEKLLNIINYYENTKNQLQQKDKEIERLNNIIYKVIGDLEDVRERLNCYGDDNFKIDMSMLTFWIDLLKEYKVGVDKE